MAVKVKILCAAVKFDLIRNGK